MSQISARNYNGFCPLTIREALPLSCGGIVTNDKGQGAGGPGYIEEGLPGHSEEVLDTRIFLRTESENPEAWELARAGFSAFPIKSEPEWVAVGDESEDGHQMIYAG